MILIMTDTTRFDMLSCYGNRNMNTPNLDSLAERGVRYERAYSAQPVCGPARSAIFTGLYPHSNGSWANCMPLGKNVKTIGERLTDNGIHCGYTGKWHLDGGDYFGLGRCPDGWDKKYWFDMRNYLEELTPAERLASRRTETNRMGIGYDFTYASRVTKRALAFLKDNENSDYFLTVSYDEPHGPYLCPEPFASMYNGYEFPKSPNVCDTLEGKPDYQKVWAGERLNSDRDALKIMPADFLGCNAYADYEIGRVLKAINAFAPEAAVIYTSDHGDALESHRLYAKGPAFYDEIARIPLIIYNGKSRGLYTYPVSHINIAPFILEYMGVPLPKMLEGVSLAPSLEDLSSPVNDAVFTEFTRYETDHDGFGGFRPMRCTFDGRFKLSLHLTDATDELYDIENDPYEMHNLIYNEEFAEIRDKLLHKILAMMNNTRDPFRGTCWENRPWNKKGVNDSWDYTGFTRQRENEEYEPKQLDYMTGLEIDSAVRKKGEVPRFGEDQ